MTNILHPGYVISQEDGDKHYVSARELARLCELDFNKCKVVDGHQQRYASVDGDMHFYPRYDGKYTKLER